MPGSSASGPAAGTHVSAASASAPLQQAQDEIFPSWPGGATRDAPHPESVEGHRAPMQRNDDLCGGMSCAGFRAMPIPSRPPFYLASMLLLAACATRLPPTVGPDAAQCLARLDSAGVRYERVDIAAAPAACAVDTPVRVTLAA